MNWLFDLVKNVVSGVLAPLFSWLNKREDTKTVQINANRDVDINRDQGDVDVIEARSRVAIAFRDKIDVSIARDIVMYPTAVWFAAIYFDSLFHRFGWWDWRVEALPKNIEYLPYAVVAFLFVSAWRGR